MKKTYLKQTKIRKIEISDVSTDWVNWLNDKKIVQFSKQKNNKHTLSSQKNFVKKKLEDKNSVLYGIFFEDNHIGLVELDLIDKFNKNCEISYFIGEKNLWGKDIASIAINMALNEAFNKLGILKVYAGVYSNNYPSHRVLLKNNFKKEGDLKNFYKYNKNRISKIFFGLDKKNYKKI